MPNINDTSHALACSLSPDALRRRADDVRALTARSLRSSERTPTGVRLHFDSDGAVYREVEALVAAEAECCSFLDFQLDRADGGLVLSVTAPPAGRAILDELFGEPVPARSRREARATIAVGREQLRREIEAGTVVVVEALSESHYESGHLPGALNLPPTEVREQAAGLLPDRDAAIVTYCSSATCPNSKLVATVLRKLGYTNVRTYVEGKQDWVDAGFPLETGRPVPVAARPAGAR